MFVRYDINVSTYTCSPSVDMCCSPYSLTYVSTYKCSPSCSPCVDIQMFTILVDLCVDIQVFTILVDQVSTYTVHRYVHPSIDMYCSPSCSPCVDSSMFTIECYPCVDIHWQQYRIVTHVSTHIVHIRCQHTHANTKYTPPPIHLR